MQKHYAGGKLYIGATVGVATPQVWTQPGVPHSGATWPGIAEAYGSCPTSILIGPADDFEVSLASCLA